MDQQRRAQPPHSTLCPSLCTAVERKATGPARQRSDGRLTWHSPPPPAKTMAMVDPYADEPLLATNNERFCMFPIKCASLSMPRRAARGRPRGVWCRPDRPP